CQQGYNTPRTF
nr:immunoglobulin light chain junction region [Macaca mulatta]MOV37670.1 immunoglobulin light chain junction region [Macaca mulatta]